MQRILLQAPNDVLNALVYRAYAIACFCPAL